MLCVSLGLVGLLATGTSAQAAQVQTWNFGGNTVDGNRCNNTFSCIFKSASGYEIKVSAYATSQANSGTGGTTPAGTLISATLTDQSAGLGINNKQTGDGSEGADPEHAADNNQRYDVFVLEALGSGAANFDWQSLGISWAKEWTYSGSTVVNRGATADIDFFVGNGDGTSFTSMCLSTCPDSGTKKITDAGFKYIDGNNNQTTGSPIDVLGSDKGRYLVVSGALNLGGDGFFDAFKLSGATGVPEPHSIALLGLGFLAMVGLRRKRPAA